MAVTRRVFVVASGLTALGALAARVAGKVDPAIAAAAPVLRPGSVGRSAGRCARCGSLAHTTLDAACPEAVASKQAVQAAARRSAERARRAGA